jgi:acetyl-CoA decarbonylase/synthase complex subunit gamma
MLAFVTGSALVPILLPWLPGRALALKGMTLGLIFVIALVLAGLIPSAQTGGILETAAWILLLPAIAAFTAMNFTGSTTYTSLSGVKKEMRFAVPAQIIVAAFGLSLWLTARFY